MQLSLFDSVPLARKSDPPTSHEAAGRHESSGKLTANQTNVLQIVKLFPGLTYAEISKRAGLQQPEAARRLPELERMNLVVRSEPRICQVRGTKCQTWRAK